jgi:hypothetical protein
MMRRWTLPAVALVALLALPAALLVTVAPAAAQAPSVPTVTANASAASAATIEVTFTTVEGAIGYLVVPQRLRANGEWAALDGRVERLSARRPVVFDGLINGTTYRACVAAILPDGQRTGLSTSAIPYGLPGAPAISSIERDGASLEVTWSAAAANGRQITAYEVTVAPDDGIAPIIVGGNLTSARIEGMRPDAEYVVSVRATNLRGQGEAGQSAAAAVSTSATFDSAPQVLTVAAVARATGPSEASAGGLLLVSGIGACGTATGATVPTQPTDDPSAAGGVAPSGDQAVSEGAEGEAETKAVGPTVTGRPAAPAEPTDADEAAEPRTSEPAPAPSSAAPAPPEPAPEASAPEPPLAAGRNDPGRSMLLIVVALLAVAGLVIGGVVVQQRMSGREDAPF